MAALRRKLIWAIDPFEEDVMFRVQLTQTLKALSQRLSLLVEPTYVLSLAKEHEFESVHKAHKKQYHQAAMRAVKKNIEPIHGVKFLPPKVLFQADSSFSMLVRKLSEYAKHSGADAIIVGTHARTGIPRLLLGSFTETLLLHSEIPVMSVGPKCVVRGDKPIKEQKILFSSDLTQDSEKIYPGVLDFANKLQAQVTVYHITPHRVEPVLQSGTYLLGGGWVGGPEAISQEDPATVELLTQWVNRGIEQGLKVDYALESKRANMAELILQQAAAIEADFIAMAAESGPVRAWVIGSITRQVVRNAPCPVWILRPASLSHSSS